MENNSFDNLSLFEKIILESHLYINIGEYLSVTDNINLIICSKKIFNNKLNREYFKYITKIVEKKIIVRFIKKIYYFKKFLKLNDLIVLDHKKLLYKHF